MDVRTRNYDSTYRDRQSYLPSKTRICATKKFRREIICKINPLIGNHQLHYWYPIKNSDIRDMPEIVEGFPLHTFRAEILHSQLFPLQVVIYNFIFARTNSRIVG